MDEGGVTGLDVRTANGTHRRIDPVVTDMTMGDQLDHLDWEATSPRSPSDASANPPTSPPVCWLVSDDSSFVNGTEIIIDGGLTASGISPTRRRGGARHP